MSAKKIFYSMGEVCEMFDVNPSLIRFWEKRFDVLRPCKNAKGNRLFTVEDVENLKIIYRLVKEKGMTLSGAEKYLKDQRSQLKSEVSVVEILQRIRSTLLEIKHELDSQANQLDNEIIIRGSNELSDFEQRIEQHESDDQGLTKPHYVELSLFDDYEFKVEPESNLP